MSIYRIAKWNEVFETAESRRHSSLRWVSMPISLSSSGYQSLLDEFGDRAASIYGAWCTLVAVAATCSVRGLLATSKGAPLKVSLIARQTGLPSALFEDLIRWAVSPSVGWLEEVPAELVEEMLTNGLPSHCPGTAQPLPRHRPGGDFGQPDSGSGISKNQQKQGENAPPSHCPGTAQATTGLPSTLYPTQPYPNTTLHNQQQQLGADAEMDLLRSLNWHQIVEDAATVKRVVSPLRNDVDYIWEVCAVSEGVMYPGFIQDVVKGFADKSIRKPRNYIEGALRKECEKQGWNLTTLRAKVPPRQTDKPQQVQEAST